MFIFRVALAIITEVIMGNTGYIYKNKDGREIELKREFKPMKEFGLELIQIQENLELEMKKRAEVTPKRTISF